MKKSKILKIILGSSVLSTICGMIIIIAVLMVFNFFGGEISDSDYIEGNMEYAQKYKEVLNKNITSHNNGYIPLSRILYFYLADDSLTFDEIYTNNLDEELKTIKPISEVCSDKYNDLYVCDTHEIESSNQVDDYPYKPFNAPIKFSSTTITSYYGQERVVYDEFDVHYAWDFAAPARTPVYSIGEGIVKTVRFNQDTNTINTSNGAGNYIEIEYDIDGNKYKATYGHLYPKSSKVKVGDKVYAWQEIAGVGTTGYSTGDHLHFQITSGSKKIDPLNLIDFNL